MIHPHSELNMRDDLVNLASDLGSTRLPEDLNDRERPEVYPHRRTKNWFRSYRQPADIEAAEAYMHGHGLVCNVGPDEKVIAHLLASGKAEELRAMAANLESRASKALQVHEAERLRKTGDLALRAALIVEGAR